MLPFDRPDALIINYARLAHLASLGLPITGDMTVLEVGAGVGHLTHYFEDLGCQVISTDGRSENVDENLHRHPWREGAVFALDLTVPMMHSTFLAGVLGGRTLDVVFCYGTLYHVWPPLLMLEDLASMCRSLFLLETCVSRHDDNTVHPWSDPKGSDQSVHGQGCHPARDWILNTLRDRLYGFSYVSVKQPDHPQFPTRWPPKRETREMRAVFVGSRGPLNLPTLSANLLMKQERI